MMLLGYIALLVVFGYLLIKATDHLVSELRDISKITQIGKYGLTAFLLAFATSLPELVVAIVSAFQGKPTLSLGNVLGSNIANISFVMGGVAFVGGSIKVVGDFLKKDLFSAFLAGSLPLLLLIDSELSRVDAVVLFSVYIWFTYTVLLQKTENLVEYEEKGLGVVHRLFLKLKHGEARRHYKWLIFWVMVLVLSADVLVRVSVQFAGSLGVPLILIGMFFIAIGTTLPELTFEIKASRSKESHMVFGNLLGSIVANSTLILGITALVRPIKLDGGFQPYLLATVAFVTLFGLFWLFVSTKRRLERWEGIALFLVYVLFILLEFSRIEGKNLGTVFNL